MSLVLYHVTATDVYLSNVALQMLGYGILVFSVLVKLPQVRAVR